MKECYYDHQISRLDKIYNIIVLKQQLLDAGYICSLKDVNFAWEDYSKRFGADWLRLEEEPSDNVAHLLSVLKVKETKMSYCIKHNPQPNNWVNVPRNECEVCIKNAFDTKKCMICREKDGEKIADGLVVCNKCEEMYF